jgi:hypothetical protein
MKTIILFLFLVFTTQSFSQSPTDAEMMNKGELCTAIVLGVERWSTYWESDLERTNGNIGTLSKFSNMAMLAYGINDRFNVIALAPHINASTSQGTVAGNKGWQDGTLALKYKAFTKKFNKVKVNVFTIIGGSTPLTDYNNDSGPTSIGLGCPEGYGRLMVEGIHQSGIYIRPQTSFHLRGNASLERNYYFTDHGYYSDEIDIPNVQVTSVALGAKLFDHSLRIEAAYNILRTIGGSEIRRQEAPLANANMDGSSYNFFAQYHPSFYDRMSVIFNYGNVISGRNIGKSRFFNVGLTYIIPFTKSQAKI